MQSPKPSADRWFFLAGEGEYDEETGQERLDHVPHELKLMRRTLKGLGMREIERPDGRKGERGLHEVCGDLGRWLKRVGDGELERPLSLFVYCTGHGLYLSDAEWALALPTYRPWNEEQVLEPQQIVRALSGGPGAKEALFGQVVLVLDACFSEAGVDGAMRAFQRADVARLDQDVWVVATARRTEEAGQLAFARAFAGTLSESDGADEFLRPDALVERLNRRLPGNRQQVWQRAAGRRTCRVLPDPAYMPRSSPGWLDQELGEWSHLARGREKPGDGGWYFTGRIDEQRSLREYMASGGPDGPLVVRGAKGVGKSALLGHLAVSGKPEWRRRLPPVVLREGLVLPDDSVHALVSAAHTTVPGLARRIGRALGLDVSGTPTADELCDVLEGLPPRTVLVDDLHLAEDDIASVVTELLDPLAEYARTTVVASAAPGVAADAVWQDHQLPVFELGPDDEGVRAYVGRRLGRAGSGRPSRGDAAEIAAACHGHFGTAVRAVDAFLAGPNGADGLARAWRAAGERSRTALLSLLASRGRPDGWCRAMLEPVRAAAACGHEAGLSAGHWAALATALDLSGATYTPQDAEEAAALLGASVTNAAAGPARRAAWRLDAPFAPESCRPDFAAAVRECVPVRTSATGEEWTDWTADPALTVLFGDVARHFPGDHVADLTSPAFWAALPGDALARLLEAGGGRALPEPLAAAVRSLAPGRDPAERAFHLKLSLVRSGDAATRLDVRRFGSWADVLWATPRGELAVPDLLAVAGGAAGDDGFVVTTHGDASVRLWSLADGEPLARTVCSGGDGIATRTALAVVDGAPLAALAVDGAGLLWRPLSGRDPEPEHTLDGATAFALHDDGRLAAGRDTGIDVVELVRSGPARSFAVPGAGRVTHVHLVGEPGDLRLVAATDCGTVTTRLLDAGVPAVRRQPLLMPAVHQVVVSSTGLTAGLLDHDGEVLVWDQHHGTTGLVVPAARERAVALAVTDDLVATAGGGRRPWLRLHSLASDGGHRTQRLPLPDQPVALAFDAGGSRLVVADVRGVFCLDVRAEPLLTPDRTEEAP